MSIDVMNDAGGLQFNHRYWEGLFGLACIYGWKPRGSVKPSYWIDEVHGKWDCNDYFSNGGQEVAKNDSHEFANALERALDHIPDDDDTSNLPPGAPSLDTLILESDDFFRPTSDPRFLFGGRMADLIRVFIRFCRHGGFTIW